MKNTTKIGVSGWHVELISAFPKRQGLASKLISHIRNDMKVDFSVCPINDGIPFLNKMGMSINNGLPKIE
ncbi:MAG: hypothetical protein PHG66_00920 [Candidatus Colwellbacteria bacterium]|nr:hypothetical protein [Candidatus Colwellbacteria bacterium]